MDNKVIQYNTIQYNCIGSGFTHECGVLQHDLGLIREYVKPDHMTVVISVDDLRF